MSHDALPTARGPRRAAWPPDGAERAIAAGRRRVRRRRAAGAALSVAALAVTATAVVARDRHDATPLDGEHKRFAVADSHDPLACAVPPADRRHRDELAVTGFCAELRGPRTMKAGVPATFTLRLCRKAGAAPFALRLRPVEVAIGGQWVHLYWHEAGDHTPGPPVEYAGGDCRTWSFSWDAVDQDGRPVIPGKVTINASLHALAWTGDRWTARKGPEYRRLTVEVTR
jgi:hypothetical protein